MRFSKAPIIGTLMAVAMASLLILPALAADGQRADRDAGPKELRVGVFDGSDTQTVAINEGNVNNAALDADDTISMATTRDTRVGSRVYVSNSSDAYDTVVVAVIEPSVILPNPSANPPVSGNDERVFVENIDTGDTIVGVGDEEGLLLEEVDANHSLYKATFIVVDPDTDPSAGQIQANDGDEIQISHESRVVTLIVDGEGPIFTDLAPDHGTIQRRTRVDLAFTVTDVGSGLREDSERDDDADPDATDPDADDDTDEEPIVSKDYGASADIALFWHSDADRNFRDADNDNVSIDKDEDIEWTEIDGGVSYQADARIVESGVNASDTYGWLAWARDRVGNIGTSDRDPDIMGRQNRTVEIDNQDPVTSEIRAGVGYDVGKDKEKTDRSAIAITFSSGETNALEKLDKTSIGPETFIVQDHIVVDVIHPNKAMEMDDTDCVTATSIDGECVDTRNRVYLILENDLEGDEEPRVQVLGGAILDLAANSNESSDSASDDVKVVDRIAPSFTVSIEGDVAADGRPLAVTEFEVAIEADERITGRPSLTLASIVPVDPTPPSTAPTNTWKIGQVETARVLSSGSQTSWTASFDSDDLSGGLIAVIVTGRDRAGGGHNRGQTPGWDGDGNAPVENDTIDLLELDAAGLLVEFDDEIGIMGELAISPLKEGEDDVTESKNAFIKITFDEAAEYTIDTDDEIIALDGDEEVEVDVDSYETVTITSITLDGEDVSPGLGRVNDFTFNLALVGLTLGEHKLVLTAEDVAGNDEVGGTDDTEYEFTFEVVQRSAYKVSLNPGWNMISLPGNPVDTSLGAVFPADHGVTHVLAYREGQWLRAAKIGGVWEGDLTDIEAGYGYLVRTGEFTSISTNLRELDIAESPPTVPIVAGWNLVGVVDIDQAKAGSPPGGSDSASDADNYFSGLNWTVAYTYSTTTSRWTKILPNEDGGEEITNGSGYWLWATRAATLVP